MLASAEDTTHVVDETTESQVPSIASKRASQISRQAESHGREQAKENSSVQQQKLTAHYQPIGVRPLRTNVTRKNSKIHDGSPHLSNHSR